MDKIIFDPSLIYITTEKWSCEKFQILYLERMIEAFEEIETQKNLRLVWSYRLEEILWSDAKYRPWSEFNNNSIIPILYKFFRKNIEYLNHVGLLSTSVPKLEEIDPIISDEYYFLINELIILQENFAYYSDNNPIMFTSSCGLNYSPYPCKKKYDISILSIEKQFDSKETLDNKKNYFRDLIINYMVSHSLQIINEFNFTSSFIRKIANLESHDIIELIEKLALRISYNSSEARACKQLQDEFITARSINEYRIRISPRPTSKRVHYIFQGSVIEFKSYFGPGEHDDGL